MLNSCHARSLRTYRRASRVPLAKESLKRTVTLSDACLLSQKCMLNTISHSTSSLTRYMAPSSCASHCHPLRSVTTVQGSWLARCLNQSIRHFHLSSKKQQHQYYSGPQYSPHRAESFTIYYRAAQLAFLGTFLAIYLTLQDEQQPKRVGSTSPRRQSTPTSTLESAKQHLSSVRQSIH